MGCQIGILSESWLSPGSLTREGIGAVVREADEVGDADLNGRACISVRLNRPQSTSHLMYFDKKTLDMVRWVRTQPVEAHGQRTMLTRQNDLELEHRDTDQGWKWRLAADQFPPTARE
jgi:hypothetical protein